MGFGKLFAYYRTGRAGIDVLTGLLLSAVCSCASHVGMGAIPRVRICVFYIIRVFYIIVIPLASLGLLCIDTCVTPKTSPPPLPFPVAG